MRREVLRGLSSSPKTLPCKYFYDARGARLFEQICQLPEYYLTRTELGILRDHLDEIARHVAPRSVVIEFGSGAGIKTRLLLQALREPAAYIPVDLADSSLEQSAAALRDAVPGLPVLPLCADFTRPLEVPHVPQGRHRLVYFPGSTLGNFNAAQSLALLRHVAELAGPGGSLLLGIDLQKDAEVLRRAYNDSAGVTAAFNLNLLARLNRELAADFDLQRFQHRADYNQAEGRVEMYLVSLCRQQVSVAGETFTFSEGEAICTEWSYKYDVPAFGSLAEAAGWAVRQVWTDPNRWFAVVLLQARRSAS